MNKEDLAEYLEKYIKPELEKYAKENNTTPEELLNKIIKEKSSKTNLNKRKSK